MLIYKIVHKKNKLDVDWMLQDEPYKILSLSLLFNEDTQA